MPMSGTCPASTRACRPASPDRSPAADGTLLAPLVMPPLVGSKELQKRTCRREIDSTQRINGSAQGLPGVHQVIH